MEASNGGSPAVAQTTAATTYPTQPFGRLEVVRIRDHWLDEARDFTPWLAKAENLALLGETIGLNLELVGTEQRVGRSGRTSWRATKTTGS